MQWIRSCLFKRRWKLKTPLQPSVKTHLAISINSRIAIKIAPWVTTLRHSFTVGLYARPGLGTMTARNDDSLARVLALVIP